MSGHADYKLFQYNIPENITIYNVPVVNATEETIKGFGEFVYDFNKSKVINVIWPKKEGRPLDNNTGDQALPTEGLFDFYYENNFCKAVNHCVPNGSYITGTTFNNCIYTREANYHPDGGQIVYPQKEGPFILLLSKKGDDIKPSDFIAFKFNGTCGFQIFPNVWHQPAYPLCTKATFNNKQGSVHACVSVDTLNEFNTILCIKI